MQDDHLAGLPIGVPVLTPRGPVPAGLLAPGDLVLATSGIGAPFQPVLALRRQRHRCGLVRIPPGAIDDSAPTDPIGLPPGLGLLLHGVLVPASALVDGVAITRDAEAAEHDLVEILLPGHDALLVAGLAAESGLPEGAKPFAPHCVPDGVLLATLAWRAEQFGWRAPQPPAPAPPQVGTRRLRLSALPLTPIQRPAPLGGQGAG
jgi:hypothetical protein